MKLWSCGKKLNINFLWEQNIRLKERYFFETMFLFSIINIDLFGVLKIKAKVKSYFLIRYTKINRVSNLSGGLKHILTTGCNGFISTISKIDTSITRKWHLRFSFLTPKLQIFLFCYSCKWNCVELNVLVYHYCRRIT